MRLITKQSKTLSRGQPTVRRAGQKRGIVITSAEGTRFVNATTPLPPKDGKKD
jgi:hypothetical protein